LRVRVTGKEQQEWPTARGNRAGSEADCVVALTTNES